MVLVHLQSLIPQIFIREIRGGGMVVAGLSFIERESDENRVLGMAVGGNEEDCITFRTLHAPEREQEQERVFYPNDRTGGAGQRRSRIGYPLSSPHLSSIICFDKILFFFHMVS